MAYSAEGVKVAVLVGIGKPAVGDSAFIDVGCRRLLGNLFRGLRIASEGGDSGRKLGGVSDVGFGPFPSSSHTPQPKRVLNAS